MPLCEFLRNIRQSECVFIVMTQRLRLNDGASLFLLMTGRLRFNDGASSQLVSTVIKKGLHLNPFIKLSGKFYQMFLGIL